jgi:hypothetical protein
MFNYPYMYVACSAMKQILLKTLQHLSLLEHVNQCPIIFEMVCISNIHQIEKHVQLNKSTRPHSFM